MPSGATILKESIMVPSKFTSSIDNAVAGAAKMKKDAQDAPRVYRAPELHVVGKAGELVQGGGGNWADNNRARQY
jgi:hypothetical protein